MKNIIVLLVLLVFAGCGPSPEEKAKAALDIKAATDKAHFDSVANDRSQRFEEERTRMKLNDMASGKVCVDTVVKKVEIHDTIRPTVSELYSKYTEYIYIIKIKFKKQSYSLSISEHVKNEANALEIEVPVDKDYYDRVSVNQSLSDEGLRMGSLMFHGSFTSWKVTVVEKHSVKRSS